MSVNNGELADQNNFNGSFISREVDSTTAAKLGLLDPDSANSGPTIANLQKAVNQSQVVTSVTQLIAAAGIIAINGLNITQKVRVRGNGGPVTTAAAPFGGLGTWPDGMRVRIQGMDNFDTVTIQNQDVANGILLRDASVTLKLYDILEAEWDSVLQRFLEVTRNF